MVGCVVLQYLGLLEAGAPAAANSARFESVKQLSQGGRLGMPVAAIPPAA